MTGGVHPAQLARVHRAVERCDRSYFAVRNFDADGLGMSEQRIGRALSQLDEMGVIKQYSPPPMAVYTTA